MASELSPLDHLVLHILYANGGEMSERDINSMVRLEVESHGSIENALRHYERMNAPALEAGKKLPQHRRPKNGG